MRRAICEIFAHAAIAPAAAATVMLVTAFAATAATPAPTPGPTRTYDAADAAGCRLHIGDAGITAHRAGDRRASDRRASAVSVGAYVACRLPVRSIWLEVTLWKTGLIYDHRQAQTTVRAADSDHLVDSMTSVTCRDRAISAFFGVAHAVVHAGRRRGDAWVKSPRTIRRPCGT